MGDFIPTKGRIISMYLRGSEEVKEALCLPKTGANHRKWRESNDSFADDALFQLIQLRCLHSEKQTSKPQAFEAVSQLF